VLIVAQLIRKIAVKFQKIQETIFLYIAVNQEITGVINHILVTTNSAN